MSVILTSWEVRIERLEVQKVHNTPSQPMAGCGGTCLSPRYAGKHK
jgi:hypothetical protein